jgi:Cu/Ag efflux protein CusF
MKLLFVVALIVGLLGAPLAWAPEPVLAQAGAEKSVEGKVKSVDAAAKTVTLEDGTTLMVADAGKLKDIKAGDMVKASYSEQGGQKTAKSIEKK